MILDPDDTEPVWQSRFDGPMADMARIYRAFLPGIAPPEVDRMTPSQVAAALGLDEIDSAEGAERVEARAWTAVGQTEEHPDVDQALTRRERRERAAAEGKAWQLDDGDEQVVTGTGGD